MLFFIDERDARPIYLQLISQIKEQINHGLLTPGDELPPVRELAKELGINLHTVRHAYQKLNEQGIIHLRLGQRARVAKPAPSPALRGTAKTELRRRLNELITESAYWGITPAEFQDLVKSLLHPQSKGGKS